MGKPREVDYEDAPETEDGAASAFIRYRKKKIAEMRCFVPGEDLIGVSISEEDKTNGSPKDGDMISRNPDNHDDQWLVAGQFFTDNYELA